MRILLVVICTTFTFLSCASDDDTSTAIPTSISGTFTHDIPDCILDDMTEMNCTEFISFDSDSEASMLLGGDDIVNVFTYRQLGKAIVVLSESIYGYNFNFEVVDAATLKNADDDTLWIKASM